MSVMAELYCIHPTCTTDAFSYQLLSVPSTFQMLLPLNLIVVMYKTQYTKSITVSLKLYHDDQLSHFNISISPMHTQFKAVLTFVLHKHDISMECNRSQINGRSSYKEQTFNNALICHIV